MKKQIETPSGTFSLDTRSGKVFKRTGQHIGTIKDGEISWIRGGWDSEMADVAKTYSESSKPRTYVQDGYNGTAADHARGFDGIE